MKALRQVPEALKGSLTPTCIVIYLALHAIWAQCVFGPYSFVYLRLLFLICIAALLVTRKRPREIHGYFIGRLLPKNGMAFVLMLLTVMVVRVVDVFALILTHVLLAPYSPNRLFSDCLVAPVNEEVLFRGVFLAVLLQQMSRRPALAILIGALVVVSVHSLVRQNAFSIDLFFGLLVANLLQGWIYLRTQSVLCCIVAHSLWNGFPFIPLLPRH